MRTKITILLVALAFGVGAVEFDPLHREFGINVGPLGRFDGNGAGVSNVVALNLTGLGSAPAADRILFYDFSAGGFRYLTVGSGLSISGTTMTSSGGSFDGNGLTLTNTTWNTDKGVTIASLNENGTFTLVDTNGNTRLLVDPIGDNLGFYDSNFVEKILIQAEKLFLDAPIIATGTALTGNLSGGTNIQFAGFALTTKQAITNVVSTYGDSGPVTNGQSSVTLVGISAGSLTATNYNFLTNGNNIGTITVGQVLYTNITGNITLGGFSGVTAGYNQWAKVIATNSTATDYKVTLAASVTTSTNAFVVGQDIWVTNKSKVHISFDIGPDTNAAALRFQR